jgi:hypothetical protein
LFSKTPNLSPSPPPQEKKTRGNKRTCGVVPNTNKMNPNRPPFFQNTVKEKALPTQTRQSLTGAYIGGRDRQTEWEERRETSERARAPHIDPDLLLSLLWPESATRMRGRWVRKRGGVCCWRIWEPVGEELSTRASWWVFFFCFLLLPPSGWLAFLLMLFGIPEFLQLFFYFWVSEWVSEKKWGLCVCVCQKGILLVCFSFLVLGFDEVLLSAAAVLLLQVL